MRMLDDSVTLTVNVEEVEGVIDSYGSGGKVVFVGTMSSRNGVAYSLDQRAFVASFVRPVMEASPANAVGARLVVDAV